MVQFQYNKDYLHEHTYCFHYTRHHLINTDQLVKLFSLYYPNVFVIFYQILIKLVSLLLIQMLYRSFTALRPSHSEYCTAYHNG